MHWQILIKSAMKNSVLVVADQTFLSFHMINVYMSKRFWKAFVPVGDKY